MRTPRALFGAIIVRAAVWCGAALCVLLLKTNFDLKAAGATWVEARVGVRQRKYFLTSHTRSASAPRFARMTVRSRCRAWLGLAAVLAVGVDGGGGGNATHGLRWRPLRTQHAVPNSTRNDGANNARDDSAVSLDAGNATAVSLWPGSRRLQAVPASVYGGSASGSCSVGITFPTTGTGSVSCSPANALPQTCTLACASGFHPTSTSLQSYSCAAGVRTGFCSQSSCQCK